MRARLSRVRGARLGLLGLLVTLVGVLALAGVASAGRPPALAFAPPSNDFGSVGVGGSVSQQFTLKNSGGSASAALTITLAGSSAFAITNDTCTATSLGPNKSCSVTVTYAPSACGASDSATLNAIGNKSAAHALATLTGAGSGIQGTITSIAAPNFTVAGVTVITDSQTVYAGAGDPKSLADFRPGDNVDVCGSLQTDGSLAASSVTRLT
jgi:Domain of unknown function (DUF5666)/Abnormal spindle-like microcephaly-assoc'd, ASPM-SPD-2-Hydin